MKIPEKVKIGPYTYEVVLDSNKLRDDDCFASCDCRHLKIFLDPDRPRARLEKSFFHELIHAVEDIVSNGHEDFGALKEGQVMWLSDLLYMVLKDNGMLAE